MITKHITAEMGMFEQFRIEGLRSLLDTGYIDISPITILLGKNSSGKSSFLRTLPLLKQTSQASTIGHILWYSPDMVDFGDFDTAVKSENKSLSFSFKIKIPKKARDEHHYYRYRNRIYIEDGHDIQEQTDVEVNINLKKGKTIPYVETISFISDDFNIKIEFDENEDSKRILVDGQDFQKKLQKISYSLRSAFPLRLSIILKDSNNFYFREDLIAKSVIESIKNEGLMPKRIENIKYKGNFYDDFLSKLVKYTSKDVIKALGEDQRKYVSKFYTEQLDKEKIDTLIGYSKLYRFNIFSNYIFENMKEIISGIKYIAPTRAFAERYYRLQNLSTDDLSPDGKNLPFMLYNISQRDKDKKSLNEWLMSTINVEFKVKSKSGHIQILLKERDNDTYLTMADMGFGYSQIIPILVSIWKEINRPRTYNRAPPLLMVIEQPELHLHPKMQGDLADMFSKAVKSAKEKKIDLKFVIETHSDHMIRKFAKLVDSNEIDSDIINIVFFEKEQGKRETLTKQLKFGKDGFISDWPVGFFDIG